MDPASLHESENPMTGDLSPTTNPSPPGGSLVDRLLARWPELSAQLVSQGLGEAVPTDRPDDHYDENVLPVVLLAGHAVLAAISRGEDPGYAQIRDFVAPVTDQHVEERLPLGRLLVGIHASARVLLDAAVAEAGPPSTPMSSTSRGGCSTS